jgi:peptidyl-prolyl cis-trans isomerase A (cyclophilin A)
MKMNKWMVLVLAVAIALASACERKAEKADGNEATEQAQDGEDQADTSEEADEADDDEADEAADDEAEGSGEEASVEELDPVLLDPSLATEEVPESFKARFKTTKGPFVVEFHRDWSPNGADRAYNLIKAGYYDGIAFFRVVEGFMAQFGIHGHPAVNEAWKEATIEDDSVEESNTRGKVTFAQRKEPNTRSTHMFINYKNNAALDEQGFAPVGEVVEGMEVVDKLYAGYGDGPPFGKGPDQQKLTEEGDDYLEESFPNLDYIESVEIVDAPTE